MTKKGRIDYENGQYYEGEYIERDGKKLAHGCGIQFIKPDMYCVGEFKDDELNGKGRCVYPDGSHFEGDFKNHQPDGFAKIFWTNGDRFEGEVKGWNAERHGKFYFAEGGWYEGGFDKDGSKSGYGVMTDGKGTIFEGEFNCDYPVRGFLSRPGETRKEATYDRETKKFKED